MLRKSLASLLLVPVVLLALSACDGKPEAASASTPSAAAAQPSKAPEVADTDNDGFNDNEDAFPSDDREWYDDNGNGVGDNQEALAAKAKQERAEARAKARQARQRAHAIANAEAPSARTWAKVVKNPDAHAGEYYVIYGQVTQFDAATGDSNFLADTADHNTMEYDYFEGDNSWMSGNADRLSDLVEDDVFRATVQVKGSYSYDTQIGGNTTVPDLKVLRIHRL